MAMNNLYKGFIITRGQTITLAALVFAMLVIIPLTLIAVRTPTKTRPRAYSPGNELINHPPRLKTSIFDNTITCAVAQPCVAQFTATDPDATESLTMSLDFLPEGVSLNPCTPVDSHLGTQAECTLTGNPTRSGKFKILATVSDVQGSSDSQIFTLNIK
jgi:hypothetical protein